MSEITRIASFSIGCQ